MTSISSLPTHSSVGAVCWCLGKSTSSQSLLEQGVGCLKPVFHKESGKVFAICAGAAMECELSIFRSKPGVEVPLDDQEVMCQYLVDGRAQAAVELLHLCYMVCSVGGGVNT